MPVVQSITRFSKFYVLFCRLSVCTSLGAVLLVSSCKQAAAQVPEGVKKMLTEHDSVFASLSFEWSLQHRHVTPPASASRVATYVERAEKQGRQHAAEHNIRDAAGIQATIESEREVARSSGSGMIWQYQSVYHFDRSQDQTYTWGEISAKQPDYSLTTTFHQWYGHGWTVLYADPAKGTHGESVVPMGPYVWGSPDDSTFYRAPFLNCLDVAPEEFVLLIGKNPLNLFGAKWQVTNTSSEGWTLQTTVTEGMNSPFTMQIKLDKQHGSLPSDIVVHPGPNTDAYHVSEWTRPRQGKEWMPARVTKKSQWGVVTEQREWKLQAVSAAKPIQLQMPIGSTVLSDVRLLGDHLRSSDLDAAEMRNDPNIVHYHWTGVLPSLDKLRDIAAKRVSLDPAQPNRLLLFAPGILLLLIGSFWYRRANKPALRVK